MTGVYCSCFIDIVFLFAASTRIDVRKRMPRRRSSIWNHFHKELGEQGVVKQVDCKYCPAKYVFPNATRMTAHIAKCEKCPETVKSLFDSKNNEKESKTTSRVHLIQNNKNMIMLYT